MANSASTASFIAEESIAEEFIATEGPVSWFGEAISIYQCRYVAESFTGNLYKYFGIPFPQELLPALNKRKAEFLAGRYCARQSLAKYGVVEAIIGRDKNRMPLWPDSYVGSITHSGDHVVAASSPVESYCGLGVDAELVVGEGYVIKSQHKILSSNEQHLMAQHSLGPCMFLTLAFSIKESFFKAVYPSVGKYFGFTAVEIRDIYQKSGHVELEVKETLNSRWKKGKLLSGNFYLSSASQVVTMVAVPHA